MTKAPRLLLVSNEATGKPPGLIAGFQALVEEGALGGLEVVSAHTSRQDSPSAAYERVWRATTGCDFEAVLILAPRDFPGTREQFDRLMGVIGPRMIIHWEGDPWGRGKSVPEAMEWWLTRAEIVFSCAGEPQPTTLLDHGAGLVFHCPHTYCHVRFAEGEESAPKPNPELAGVMIIGNYARVPLISGLPGSSGRWLVASRLRSVRGKSIRLYGTGWPRTWACPLPYDQQVSAIRKAAISVNWDHYPAHEDYASDRLAISLLAGRPHVTTKHPGMAWAPTQGQGLFQESNPIGVIRRARSLWAMDPGELHRLGLEGRSWVLNRMSTRQAARYMMSVAFPDIPAPGCEPWTQLPGPWR